MMAHIAATRGRSGAARENSGTMSGRLGGHDVANGLAGRALAPRAGGLARIAVRGEAARSNEGGARNEDTNTWFVGR